MLLQIGRAGRDGSESYCHLFLDDCDFLRLRALAHSDGIQASNALGFLQAVFEERQSFVPQSEVGNEAEYGTLAVARVSEECDMKEEVMETLLSYLEVCMTCLCCQCNHAMIWKSLWYVASSQKYCCSRSSLRQSFCNE